MGYKNHTVDNGGDTGGYDPAPAIPTGIAVDDFLVAVITRSNDTAGDPTPPAGWTLEESADMPIETAAVSNSGHWIYTRTADQGDVDDVGTSPYTWTFGGSLVHMGVMILCDPAEWGEWAFDITTGDTESIASISAPSVTTTVNDELAFYIANRDAGYNFTVFPTGDVTIDEAQGNTNGAGMGLGIVIDEIASPGATGAQAFTVDPSDQAVSCTFTLRPLAVAARDQEAFRFADDDGDEDDATFLASQNTDISRAPEAPFRVRIGTQLVGDPATETAKLQYKETSDGATEWRDV